MKTPRAAKSKPQSPIPNLGPIETVPTALLKSYGQNARKHSERQVALIAQSLEAFGFNNPIIAEEDGTIIAGHGRWEAAKQLKLEHVPVLRVRHLTPDKVRAYRLADNRLAELAGWDEEMLVVELGELATVDLGFSIETIGWTFPEIDVMLDPPEAGGSEGPSDSVDHDIPELPVKPVSRPGDLWKMGEHRLLVGSSLDPLCYDVLMAGALATMVFQDAPYNVKINGHVSGLGKVKHAEFAMASGEMSAIQFREFLAANLKALSPHLVDGAILAMCMDWRGFMALQLAMEAARLDLINLAVWVKTNAGMGSLLRSQHELVAISKHGKAPHINNVQLGKNKRYRTNVWRYPGVNSFGRGRMGQLEAHPTPKPVPLVADAIRDVSHRGQIVLDTFMGSGTTLLAAERTGRICYGIDIEPGYVDVSILRWKKLTNEEARLEATGETFEEVRTRRVAETAPTVDNESATKPLLKIDNKSIALDGDEVA